MRLILGMAASALRHRLGIHQLGLAAATRHPTGLCHVHSRSCWVSPPPPQTREYECHEFTKVFDWDAGSHLGTVGHCVGGPFDTAPVGNALRRSSQSWVSRVATTETMDARALPDRTLARWRSRLPIVTAQPQQGSWLAVRTRPHGISLGCWVCARFAPDSGPYAAFQISSKGAVHMTNFRKHASQLVHKRSVATYELHLSLANGCKLPAVPNADDNAAPSPEEFGRTLQAIAHGQAILQSKKGTKLAFCLHEAMKIVDQKHAWQTQFVSLIRDERNGRVAVRFRTVDAKLREHHALMGIDATSSTGAHGIIAATQKNHGTLLHAARSAGAQTLGQDSPAARAPQVSS